MLTTGNWELDEADAADLRPDLLRRDVLGRRVGRLAEDPEAASDRVEAAIGIILTGLQSLAESGQPPGPTTSAR